MPSDTYAQRHEVHELSWTEFAGMARVLAEALTEEGVEVVLGIARGGLFPATAVACALHRELLPVRVVRRLDDRIAYPLPVWKLPVQDPVAGRIVAIVDELVDTGETLALVAEDVRRRGAARAITAALVAHGWATPPPHFVALETDALVIFPWEREVLADGRWQPHPEQAEALETRALRRRERDIR